MEAKKRQITGANERRGISAELAGRTFAAIKADDVKAFRECAETAGTTSLKFGRFPILSLMYLYGSRKLLKLYDKSLAGLSAYVYAPEEPEAYAAFREKAGKALRLYLSEDCTVSPPEMLLILGRTDIFPEIYAACYKTAELDGNLSEIRRLIYGIEREKGEKGFRLPKPALSGAQKRYLLLTIVISALVLILSGTLGILSFLAPEGSAEKPVKIDNADSLKLALGGTANYLLTDDLYLSEWEPRAFGGTLDGGGHTLSFSEDAAPKGFLTEITGTVKNLKIVFEEFSAELAEQKGFFANKNSGTASGVEIKFSASLTIAESVEREETEGDDSPMTDAEREAKDIAGTFMVSPFILENRGAVSGCKAELHLSVSGGYKANACFGGIAGVNYGAVNGCAILDGSAVTADTVDIAGIAGRNATGGIISGALNCGAFVQTSSSSYWNPNTAGIVLINYGKITESENKGLVSATSSNGESSEIGRNQTIAGGLASVNYRTIEWSKNNGAVSAAGIISDVYAGGAAGLNGETAELYKCISYAQITADLESGEAYGFGGGLAGFNSGYIMESFSLAPLGGSGVTFGGIAGAADYLSVQTTVLSNDKHYLENYYTFQNSTEFGIGRWLVEGYGGIECGTAGASSEELKSKDGFWG